MFRILVKVTSKKPAAAKKMRRAMLLLLGQDKHLLDPRAKLKPDLHAPQRIPARFTVH